MSVNYHAPKQIAFFALSASVLLLVAAPVKAFSTNQRDILMLKIFLGISSTMAGATLLWQHRPSRIDDTLDKLGQTAELQQQRIAEVNQQVQQTVVNTVNKANERILAVEEEYQSLLEQKDQEAQQLRQQLAQAHYPKLPPETTPANCSCRAIQLALWREGVILDWDRNQPATKVIGEGKEYDQYILEPRNQNHMVKLLKMRSDAPSICEFALGEDGAVKIVQSGNRIVFKYYPGEETTRKQKQLLEQKNATKLAKLPTLQDLANCRLGFFIAGSSGSGKTTSALFIAEAISKIELSQEDLVRFREPEKLEALAIDVHGNDPSNARGWDMLGVKAVWKPDAILEQLELLEDEFEARKAGSKGNRILILFDEYSETYKAMKRYLLNADYKNSEVTRLLAQKAEFITSLATGGARKFGMIPIVMNQSWSCHRLKMDGSERNNFIGIYLNKLAQTYAENVKVTNIEALKLLKENRHKYRSLVSGGYPDSYMPHPSFPNTPLTITGKPPERTPQVKLSAPTTKIVNWGIREPVKLTVNAQKNGGENLADKFSANSPPNELNSTENISGKGLEEFSAKFSDEFSINSPLESVENPQTQLNQEFSEFSVPDYPPKNPKITGIYQGENLAPEDLARLEKIHELWAVGEKRITKIIPQVWADIRGDKLPEKWVKSRGYRKCRDEYKRLTGK